MHFQRLHLARPAARDGPGLLTRHRELASVIQFSEISKRNSYTFCGRGLWDFTTYPNILRIWKGDVPSLIAYTHKHN